MPPPVVRVPKYVGRGAFVDVPSYTGNAGKALVVNGTGDGFAYVSVALATHVHAGEDITSGTIADARIASTITRDSEVMGIVLASDGSGSGLDADLLDGLSSSAFATAGHNHTGTYQPLDDELTAIAGLVSAANTVPSFTGSGTATLLPVGTAANNLVKLDANAKLPAVDGSQLTNLPGGGGGTPGGSTTQVQYNASGAFAGDAGMTYDAVNDALTVSGRVVTGVIRAAVDGATAGQWQSANGTAIVIIDTSAGRMGLGTTPGALFDALSPSATTIVFRLKAASGQSADLFDIRDNSNAQKLRIAYDGTTVFSSSVSGSSFAAGTNSINSFGVTVGSGNEIDFATSVNKIYMPSTGKMAAWARTAITAAINDTFIVVHNSSGTPANGIGVGLLARIETSTNEDTDAGRLSWQWSTVTHASRASKGQLSAYYTTTERPAITWGADSSGPLLSFGAVTTPIATQVLATAAGRTVDDVITALQNLGLVKQS